jgi:DNA-binding LytR/AlgR family response regulator
MKVLIVDDEYLALNLLEAFIAKVPGLELVAKVKSAIKALEVLEKESIDLLFLDIQMPDLKGNQLLRTLKHPPLTIFTTAYSDYAIEAFDLDAIDYLLKPFSFERFLQAVNKARAQFQSPGPAIQAQQASPVPEFLALKVDGKVVKIWLEEILFVEGLKEYVRVVTPSGKYVTFERMKNLEQMLPASRFMRVHKSFIVSKEKVQALNGNRLEIDTHLIPISRSKKEQVVQSIFGKDI